MSEHPQVTRVLIVKNWLLSLISWALPISLALIVTPAIVHGLGEKAYGLFAVISGFISYSFTFGIGRVAAKYVAELHRNDEKERLSAAISAVLLISLVLGLGVIALVGFAADDIVTNVLEIPAESAQTAISALYVAAVTILLTMVSQVFQFILQGLHRFDRFLLISNLSAVFLSIGNVALVLNGYGVVALVVWNCALTAAGALLFANFAIRLLPGLRPTILIDKKVWLTVASYAVSIVGYQLFGNALLLFERAWIVKRFGTEQLTYYVVPMALGFYFHGLVASLVVVLFPVVNELLNDPARLAKVYRTSTKAILALAVYFLVVMTLAGKPFLRVWMGDAFADRSYDLLVTHAFTFGILALVTVVWQVTESFGAAKLNAVANGAWFFIAVPLMVVLSETWQTEGVAAARLIGVFVLVPLIVITEHRFLGGFKPAFWISLLVRLLIAAVAGAATQWMVFRYMSEGWVATGLAVVLGGGIFAGVLWLAGFVAEDEAATLAAITARIKRSVS
ncbi:MAG: oligosaccharide flippase family protein [Pyrinomonadaceae bacterium]